MTAHHPHVIRADTCFTSACPTIVGRLGQLHFFSSVRDKKCRFNAIGPTASFYDVTEEKYQLLWKILSIRLESESFEKKTRRLFISFSEFICTFPIHFTSDHCDFKIIFQLFIGKTCTDIAKFVWLHVKSKLIWVVKIKIG